MIRRHVCSDYTAGREPVTRQKHGGSGHTTARNPPRYGSYEHFNPQTDYAAAFAAELLVALRFA